MKQFIPGFLKQHRWVIAVGAVLIACSTALYLLHYALFRDPHYMFFYMVQDMAFLPLQVLLVVIVIEGMLGRREKRIMLRKMNMPIGLFFSELGTELLGRLTDCVRNRDELKPYLAIGSAWTARNYRRSQAFAGAFDYKVDIARLDLYALRETLVKRHNLLLTLLANPSLLEHEEFTDLLWAIFHLMEELAARKSLTGLPQTDADHLAGDVLRVYSRLTTAWLRYCEHLQSAYPYIFSILVRTQPIQDHADATVR
jgi:hypothetical protein